MRTLTNTDPALRVLGSGRALPGVDLPGSVVDNAELSQLHGRACEQLRRAGHPGPLPPCDAAFPLERLGIEARHVADADLTAEDLAVHAARDAMAAAARSMGLSRAQLARRLRAVIVASVTAHEPVPAMATTVAGAVGAPPSTLALDVVLGCNGFLGALAVARGWLAGAPPDALALVVGAETMTRVLDASDRGTLPIFGDAGAALIVAAAREARSDAVAFTTLPEFGARIRITRREPEPWPLLRMQSEGGAAGLAVDEGLPFVVRMDGRRVYREMVRQLPELVARWLADRGHSLDDFEHLAFHQANARLVAGAASGLGARLERCLLNIDSVANTTSASIPLLLDDAARTGRLRSDQRILAVGFGTGYSVGITSLVWN